MLDAQELRIKGYKASLRRLELHDLSQRLTLALIYVLPPSERRRPTLEGEREAGDRYFERMDRKVRER